MMQRNEQTATNIRETQQDIEQKLAHARTAIDSSLVQVAAILGDPNAKPPDLQARLAKAPDQNPPPARRGGRKARWRRPNAQARREAARSRAARVFAPGFCRVPIASSPSRSRRSASGSASVKSAGKRFGTLRASRCVRRRTATSGPSSSWSSARGQRPTTARERPRSARSSAWCSAFFAGCTVRVADDRLPLKRFAENAREGMEGQPQIKVGDVFDALGALRLVRLHSASASSCSFRSPLSMVDIYPGDGWNFVFGQARSGGPGRFSFARYYPGSRFPLPWTGADVAAGAAARALTACGAAFGERAAAALMLRRSCKVLTHEIGHIFGMKHCIYYECLIAGCNHLTEFDKRPLFLCPIDVRKLQPRSAFGRPVPSALGEWRTVRGGEKTARGLAAALARSAPRARSAGFLSEMPPNTLRVVTRRRHRALAGARASELERVQRASQRGFVGASSQERAWRLDVGAHETPASDRGDVIVSPNKVDNSCSRASEAKRPDKRESHREAGHRARL